jgi:hypothetical protein
MSIQTFACPACGSRKAIDDPRPGEKIHCTCGMSFPASPVFAVADAGGKKMSGTGWAFAASVALLIGCAGAAAWLMTRTTAGQPDPSGRQVAVAANPGPDSGRASTPVEPRPDPAPEQPTTTRPDPDPPAPTPTPANPPTPPTPENPPVKPAPAPQPPPPPAPAATLTAVKLWDAFDLDEEAAKARYVGKVLEVSGHGRVAKNSLGRPFFGMEVVSPRPGRPTARLTPAERRWEKEGYPPSVRCYLTPDQEAALEKLSPGQPVILRGTCVGRKNMEDVYRSYIVELDNCVLVTPK